MTLHPWTLQARCTVQETKLKTSLSHFRITPPRQRRRRRRRIGTRTSRKTSTIPSAAAAAGRLTSRRAERREFQTGPRHITSPTHRLPLQQPLLVWIVSDLFIPDTPDSAFMEFGYMDFFYDFSVTVHAVWFIRNTSKLSICFL